MANRGIFIILGGCATVFAASPVFAAPTLIGTFSGNECNGSGGFNNCFAFQNGTTSQGAGDGSGSPAIFKLNSDGTTAISTKFPSITGSEFTVTYTQSSNQLSFTYSAGTGDPAVHYFAIDQANTVDLYYDATPITSDTIALTTLFPKNPGYSHITFFGAIGSAVPEPASWAMMIVGIGAVGFAMRRRERVSVSYA